MSLKSADIDNLVYPAYKANIHEQRLAAYFARAVPVLLLITTLALAIYGVFREHRVLLFLCAILNTWFWIYLSSSAIFSIVGARSSNYQIEECAEAQGRSSVVDGRNLDSDVDPTSNVQVVTHLIVLPNYKEDEDMMAQTLHSLSEATGSRLFRVVLAMEERESGAREKATRLIEKFSSHFAWIGLSLHPDGLTQEHMDGSWDNEVPGKASNLKFAVEFGHEECQKAEPPLTNLDRIVVTVADADCIFHPSYFDSISKDFVSKDAGPGSGHRYTMWQAPQLPFRNFWSCPLPSRIWGYLASVDEFGGVSSLAYGGHHMVFSGYSLTMRLAVDACPWDGDVVAEDHHCYLRCFFYSLHAAAVARLEPTSPWTFYGITSALSVRPVFLPVKSTSVASPPGEIQAGAWIDVQGWLDRWQQARRHSQGVSEFSYALLATWDLLCSMPRNMIGLQLIFKVLRADLRLFCMHMLPILQSIGLGILTLNWLIKGRHIPYCPDHVALIDATGPTFLCGMAGAWVLVWPMLVPMFLFVIANYMFLLVTFVRPSETARQTTIWHGETGEIPSWCGHKRLALALKVTFDIFVPMVAVAIPFSFIPEVIAYFHVCFVGNRIKYVTAAKGITAPNYGSTATSDGPV
mmetsp:Transcript_93622/g.190577  ORF Transcript_93622/g.190577 Transcript_93622/m.190577 type:complete len:633 (+) Transcript_93622:3-1901(+)